MGYPRNWGYWEPSWTSHNLARQVPFTSMTARAELFAEAGEVRVAEARAQAYSDRIDQGRGFELPRDDWQRRTLALVDVGPDRFYGVDFYRISGGKEHWWCLHGQEGRFTTQGITLAKQPGTLAGPDVPYGDAAWLQAHGCSRIVYGWHGEMFAFPHLYNVERGRAEGVWSADWLLKTGDGLHLRVTIPQAPGVEVNLCDGRSPAGGPYEMKWILLHAQGAAPVKTQVLSVLEAYRGQPTIRRVRPLAVTGGDEPGIAAMACEVQLADATDTLIAAADPAVAHSAGAVRFAGRFGFCRQQRGAVVALSLVGGTRLAQGPFAISLKNPEYRGKILRVHRGNDWVVVSPPPPNVAALVGADIFIGNSDRRAAYRVLESKALPGAVALRLNWDSRIGAGQCQRTGDYRLFCATPCPLHHFRYYHGARLTRAADGADGAAGAEYRILEARSGKEVLLDARADPQAKADRLAREFPPGTWFDLYDYGVGDEVTWPYAVSLRQVQPNAYRLVSPAPVEVHLPEDCRLLKE
jgi:hypothetical protein